MDLNRLITTAVDETSVVVRGVKADQLDAPTPCSKWNVRALTNHLLQVTQALDLTGRNADVPNELWARDLLHDRWADRFNNTARAAAAAWADPSSWEGLRNVSGAEIPAPLAAAMFVSDLVIHGWDLARATGQDYHCDAAVAEATLQLMTDMGERGRQMNIYAAPVAAAEDASALDKAIALSGRDPQWRPSPWASRRASPA